VRLACRGAQLECSVADLVYRSPSDFADSIRAELIGREFEPPPVEILRDLAQTLFAVSLRTEEGQSIVVQCVFMDPENPDPDPPERITPDRWTAIPLGERASFSVESVVKLATATDPRTSSLAVYTSSEDGLSIWGLVDQANRYYDFLNFDSDSGPTTPGLFHIGIEGPGHLSAWTGYDRIAELRVSELLGLPVDALGSGSLRDALDPAIQAHIAEVFQGMPAEMHEYCDHWNTSLTGDWISLLCRLLLRARNHRHGGAILLTPDTSEAHLSVKYRLPYGRLRAALTTSGIATIKHTYASDQIHEDFLDSDLDELPTGLYLDEAVYGAELKDIESEIDGAVWFTSLLTRVDGLVLMTPRLEVCGFGVEITAHAEPSMVVRALDPEGGNQEVIDYAHYGTRHRSMMRYCHAIPGSVGFVISQDGDVRAMLSQGEGVVVWENLKIQFHNFRDQLTQ